jgi:hypothetical protein
VPRSNVANPDVVKILDGTLESTLLRLTESRSVHESRWGITIALKSSIVTGTATALAIRSVASGIKSVANAGRAATSAI